jgi:hypothetical protein
MICASSNGQSPASHFQQSNYAPFMLDSGMIEA